MPGRRPHRLRQVDPAAAPSTGWCRTSPAALLPGRVTVAGRDTRDAPAARPRRRRRVVGQDPLAGFVTDTVEEELAYGMESLGVPPDVMRRRVEETLDLLGLADLRDRPLATLSGGQQQRVAIGSVLTAHPRVLVLDEPTSALDPAAAEEVLAALQRLVHDLGMTVLMAEHRLERVVQYADRVVLVPGGGRPLVAGDPADVMATAPVAPPVVELGRLAGWSPLPLSVRDARRRAARAARAPLADAAPVPAVAAAGAPATLVAAAARRRRAVRRPARAARRRPRPARRRGRRPDGPQRRGQVHPAVGAASACAARTPARCGWRARTRRRCPARARPAGRPGAAGARRPALRRHRRRRSAPQADARRRRTGRDGAARCSTGSSPASTPAPHPRDLSEGQRLALALAVVLAGRPPRACCSTSRPAASTTPPRPAWCGCCASSRPTGTPWCWPRTTSSSPPTVADRRSCSPTARSSPTARPRDVVVSSPAFAPQVAKVLAPLPWLTVAEVAAALEAG